MQKRIFLIVLVVVLLSGFTPVRGGDLGLGIIIGEPTGLSSKLWLSPKSAVDGGLAWSFEGHGSLYLHLDYLRHDFNLIHVDKGKLPLYYGIGGRLLFLEGSRWWRDPHVSHEFHFGLRIPVGLEYILSGNKVGLFLEIAPVLDLTPSTELDVNGGIGIRYFF